MLRSHSAGGVVVNPQGQVLIVNQRGRSWSLPKGHLEPGENALDAAKREIAEESGITHLEFVSDLLTYERFKIGREGGEDAGEVKVITLFLFRTLQTDLRPSDPDNPEARWVNKKDVAHWLTHPKDKEAFLSITETHLF